MLLFDPLAYRLYRQKPRSSSAGGYFLKSYTLLVLALHHEANVPLFEWARGCNLPFRRVFKLMRRYKQMSIRITLRSDTLSLTMTLHAYVELYN